MNDLKSGFMALTAQDIGTPLTLILAATELLEKSGKNYSNEEWQEYLARIRQVVEQMVSMTNVMSFISLDKAVIQPSLASCELVQFCREIAARTQLVAGAKHSVKFVSSLEEFWAQVDQNLLYQAVLNLLNNAIKYSLEDGTVQLELVREDNKIIIRVRDEGIGIPMADQPYIFEVGYRGANIGTIEGSGLGLAIVKKIVMLHRGQIRFVSRAGVGSIFSITLYDGGLIGDGDKFNGVV